MNNRPLTSVYPKDLEPLTPNHLLLLKGQPVMPPGIFVREDMYSVEDGDKHNTLQIFFGNGG